MKECKSARREIRLAIDQRLGVERVLALEAHLAQCPTCRRSYEEARALEEALQSLPQAPIERLDLDRSVARILARIDAGEVSRTPRSPSAARRLFPLALAAAALALLTLGWWSWHGRARGERPSADDPALGPGLAFEQPAERAPLEETPTLSQDALAEAPESEALASALPSEVPPAEESVAESESDFDGARHARALDEVAGILRASSALLSGADGGDAAALVAAVDEGTRELARGGWPVLRLVQRALGSAEPEVVLAAVRYLGLRGDRVALRELVPLLEREPLNRAAARALAEAGPASLEDLRASYWDPALAPHALGCLDQAAPGVQQQWILAALADGRTRARGEPARSAALALLDRLDALGAGAELLALAENPLLERKVVLERFARFQGAAALLVQETKSSRSAYSDELLLEAVARCTPPECLEWVLRRARSSRRSLGSVLALASYPGRDPLLLLLELRPGGHRADEENFAAAWARALETDSLRFVELASDKAFFTDPSQMQRLLEALVLSESARSAPALVALAGRKELPEAERERAVLLAGELGGPADVEVLRTLYADLGLSDARLAAAIVWVVHRLAGEQGLRSLLQEGAPELCERILERLALPGSLTRPTSTLLHLERLFQSWLAGSGPSPKESR